MPLSMAGKRKSWRTALEEAGLLQLPAAHDALTARLVQMTGFPAFQVGGFALVGSRYAQPDVDLQHYGEKLHGVREIIAACDLPVLVDADDGYGDVKNVTRVIQGYEAIGVSAIFLEDQTAPKRCGHMGGKHVVSRESMQQKIRAAVSAKSNPDTFLLARTDAIEAISLDEALRRGELYLNAGADGVYVEGPRTDEELARVGRAFSGAPLATSILERGGVTPWLSPGELRNMGFNMVLYPTTILFRTVKAIERALGDLMAGRPLPETDSADMQHFEEVVRLSEWARLEDEFEKASRLKRIVQSVVG